MPIIIILAATKISTSGLLVFIVMLVLLVNPGASKRHLIRGSCSTSWLFRFSRNFVTGEQVLRLPRVSRKRARSLFLRTPLPRARATTTSTTSSEHLYVNSYCSQKRLMTGICDACVGGRKGSGGLPPNPEEPHDMKLKQEAAKPDEDVVQTTPPVAPERPRTVKIGYVEGEDRGPNPMKPAKEKTDAYYWLRDDSRTDAQVISHLKKENAYTKHMTRENRTTSTSTGRLQQAKEEQEDGEDESATTRSTDQVRVEVVQGAEPEGDAENRGLEQLLYKEHLSHLKETDSRPPYRYGKRYRYYTRTVEGLSYKFHCREACSSGKLEWWNEEKPAVVETILLDENKVAEGQTQCDVSTVAPSPCHQFLAYCVDFSGDEAYHLRILDLASGDVVDEVKTIPAAEQADADEGAEDVEEGKDASKAEQATSPAAMKDEKEKPRLLSGNVAWSADHTGIFYVTQDVTTRRPNQLWFHQIKADVSTDQLLFTEDDALFTLEISKSKDGNFLFRNSVSSETTEVGVIDLQAKQGGGDNDKTEIQIEKEMLFQPRKFGHRYELEHWKEGRFIALSNVRDAANMRVLISKSSLPLAFSSGDPRPNACAFFAVDGGEEAAELQPYGPSWTELFPYDESREVAAVEVFERFLVFEGREKGLTEIWWSEVKEGGQGGAASATASLTPISSLFPDAIFETYLSVNKNYDEEFVRVVYSSLVNPTTWYEFYPPLSESDFSEISARRPNLKQSRQEAVPNFDPAKYTSARTEAASLTGDGARIPISLVWNKEVVSEQVVRKRLAGEEQDVESSSTFPLLLYGYGSYGHCVDPGFDRDVIPYLDRGIIYAIAHIRGGGEMGRKLWYEEQGKYLTKKNTFTDFISCAKFLCRRGGAEGGVALTDSSKLAMEGRSAGGLLVGAVLNLEPELFKVCVAGVPFVDVLTTMSDASIPLTVGEWEEWGNPNEEKFYEYMKSYSPVDNVPPPKPSGDDARNTTVLILAGLHDPRVAYWEPAKWAQLLRKSNRFKSVLLKTDLDVGHFSASDRYRHIRETSFSQAVVLRELIGDSPGPS